MAKLNMVELKRIFRRWIRGREMPLNGTLTDEIEVLRVCLGHLQKKQVVLAYTSPPRMPSEQERKLYLQRELKEVSEETLVDFFEKNREGYPIEPDYTLDGRFQCVSDKEL